MVGGGGGDSVGRVPRGGRVVRRVEKIARRLRGGKRQTRTPFQGGWLARRRLLVLLLVAAANASDANRAALTL